MEEWKKQNADGRSRSGTKSPGTTILMAQNTVQFILEDLELLLCHESFSALTGEDKIIRSLKENLETLRYFLESVQETWIHHSTIPDLVLDISTVMGVLLAATDSYVRSNTGQKNICAKPTSNFLQHYSEVANLVRKIKTVEGEVIAEVPRDKGGESSTKNSSRQIDSSILEENVMVGFDVEATDLLDKLTRGTKQLEVISIIGMGGIGKTTLAKRLYNDPRIAYHFHVLAWTSVSELYEKRKFLQNLLSSIVHDKDKDPVFNMSDAMMEEKLYKSLKGRRYFIVIDDIWNTIVWNDLEILLPKDDNGSRVLMTSRSKDVALEIRPDNPPHLLRFLNQDESWNLFKRKVFPENIFPKELTELGKRIVEKCKGLPLAIAVIAGVLAKEEKTEKWWRDFAENLRSPTSSESMEYMDILELSYKHLPMWLKSCFLYLGTFPKDQEIPAKRLIWSWIGEGFIQHAPGKRLEDVAEDCLMDLVNRSLVIIAKKSSYAGIKSCEIHDLLRDLCLRKAKEKKFLQPICQCHMIIPVGRFRRPVSRFRSLPDSNVIDPFSS